MMRGALVSFFFVICLFTLSVFFFAKTIYASTAQCLNEAGFCIASGVCRGEPGYHIEGGIRCDSSTQVCCVPDVIQTACETNRTGTCRQTCSSGETNLQNLYGNRSQISCSPYSNRSCCSSCSFNLRLMNPGSTVEGPDPIVCIPSCGQTSSTQLPFGSLWVVDYSYCGGWPTVFGSVYVDNNRNGTRDSGEPGYGGATLTMVRVSPYQFPRSPINNYTGQSNSSGNYSFTTGYLGTHTVTLTVPAGYIATTATSGSRNITTSNFTNRTFSIPAFGIVPVYSITGSVFNDCSRNYVKDTCPDKNGDEVPETKDWTAGISISRSPANGSVSVNQSSGTFSITGLFAGTYTVSLSSSIPTAEGYSNRHPVNGPPPQFSVTVGGGCGYSPLHPNTSGRATCNSRGDVSNLNFVVSNSNPWFQAIGLDVRMDNGINNLIPANPLYPPYMSIIDNLD